MDFIAWCENLLALTQEKMHTDQQTSIIGVSVEELIKVSLSPLVAQRPDLRGSGERATAHYVIQEMKSLGLLDGPHQTYVRLTQQGREHLRDPLPLWTAICGLSLEDDHAVVLRTVNQLSIVQTSEGAFLLKDVIHDHLLAELGWSDADFDRLYAAVAELERMGLLWESPIIGRHIQARSTYSGAMWDMRQGETLEATFIDRLLAEGETTSVDFKRELHLDKDNEKAEFVKDVLGLATTQASGRRWLIIGVDDKSHAFYAPPNPDITQNRIEQILHVYTSPQVQVHYEVVTYRGNQVGRLEIFRDRTHLPYRVAQSLGGKKRIEEGDIFVRHGSQTEHPTPAELLAIEEEAERARAQRIAESA